MYSRYKEEKPVIAERFIRTLKNNIYKYMISISKNVDIDKLDDIVNKYKITDQSQDIYINFNKENNKEGPNFKVGDNVRISRYKNIFAKG